MRPHISWYAASLQRFWIVIRRSLSSSSARLVPQSAPFVALFLVLTSWAVAADPASYVVQDLGVFVRPYVQRRLGH